MLEPEGKDATNISTMHPVGDVFATTDDLHLLEPANVFYCRHGVLRSAAPVLGPSARNCYNHVLKMLEPTTRPVAFGRSAVETVVTFAKPGIVFAGTSKCFCCGRRILEFSVA